MMILSMAWSLPLSGRAMRFSPPGPGTFIPETETT